jgi:hypothetical protein
LGIFADLRASARTIDLSPPSDGASRPVAAALIALEDRVGDRPYPTGFDVENEVQTIATAESDDGTYTLTVNLSDGTSFTTAAIDHDANAAAIQSAINSANGSLANDTIVVTGGPLDSDDVVLTFSGAGVAGLNHGLTVVESELELSAAPVAAPAVTATNEGQTTRPALAILYVAGVIGSPPPAQGESTVVAAPTNPQTNPHYPDQGLIRALAREAAVVEGSDTLEQAVLDAAGVRDR